GRAGKFRLDRRDQRAARPLELAHLLVGVEHGHALVGEHARDGRLAHADRAGEAEHDHGASRAISAASSGGASAPKRSRKAARACPTSITSPFTLRSDKAPALLSSSVSSGA